MERADLYSPLPLREVRLRKPHQFRVMAFNPHAVFSRLGIYTNRRHQVHLTFSDAFPPIEGHCSCGCGLTLTGRRRRWATDDCTRFALDVWAIVDGQTAVIKQYVAAYQKRSCARCRSRKGLKVDHKIPVKHSGGGCWLANFQLLCHTCHLMKTNEDRVLVNEGTKKSNVTKTPDPVSPWR